MLLLPKVRRSKCCTAALAWDAAFTVEKLKGQVQQVQGAPP